MRRIRLDQPEPLFDVSTLRNMETWARAIQGHDALVSRAGASVARLALALQPHARTIWIACGPGYNGADGLYAAANLHRWSQERGGRIEVVVTHEPAKATGNSSPPPDPAGAMAFARASGVHFHSEPPEKFDLGIDAVFGIGLNRAPTGRAMAWISRLRESEAPVLSVDIPSGLDSTTGAAQPAADFGPAGFRGARGLRHTLTFLALKPGLFTHSGRDLAGDIWLEDFGLSPDPISGPVAWLHAEPAVQPFPWARPHSSHKGRFGEVLVVGGQDLAHNGEGMTGAALLAARSALHAGCGRVYVLLVGHDGPDPLRYDPSTPELMFRSAQAVFRSTLPDRAVVVCGCGGGSAVESVLPNLLPRAPHLVLDADALNAIARQAPLQRLLRQRAGQGWTTVLTPHPLEAARLLGSTTPDVMNDRLKSAAELARQFNAWVVLKGSGSVVVGPDVTPRINASGNALLATAGTGDVLAGMMGAALALRPTRTKDEALSTVCSAVHQHGWLADHWAGTSQRNWPRTHASALTAGRLADAIGVWL